MFRRTRGTPGADLATLCFSENLVKFEGDNEKHGLYQGLMNLALALQEMQGQIESLRRDVILIKQNQIMRR